VSSSSASLDVKSFIDHRGITGRQWLLVLLCFLIVAADGIDVAIMGFLAPSIIQEWGISRAGFGLVMSAAPVGLVIGALVAGPSSDRLGRKTVLLAAVLAFGICTVLTAFTQDVPQMVVMRFLTGIGLGAAMPNTTTLLAEYVPERRRSLLITVMFIGFGVGSAVVGFAAGWMIPHLGWRSVLLAGGALPLVLLPFLVFFLPESVRFMLVRKFPAERIAVTLGRVCDTRFAAGTNFFAPEPPIHAKKPIGVLFSEGYTVITVSLWVTYFMGLLVIYLITGWLPTLMKDAGLPITQAANITAMFQTGGILGAVLTGWAMDRLKPTWVIAAAYLGGAICVLGVGSAGPTADTLPIWMLAAGFFMNGAQTGLNAFAPACYPTMARATGVSWMQGMGRFGSILGSAVGGVLLGMGWGFAGIVSALAVPAAIATVAMLASQLGAKRVQPEAKTLAHS
jgi:AAHS family 4-hydroxybenzoate transporter-like MFS transporter